MPYVTLAAEAVELRSGEVTLFAEDEDDMRVALGGGIYKGMAKAGGEANHDGGWEVEGWRCGCWGLRCRR